MSNKSGCEKYAVEEEEEVTEEVHCSGMQQQHSSEKEVPARPLAADRESQVSSRVPPACPRWGSWA